MIRTWKKYISYGAAIVLLIPLLAGCAAKTKAGQTELTVLLDWYPNAVHSFLYAAEEQGYFEDAGLKVHLKTPADTNDAIKLVASGKADLALSYQMQVAISRGEDIPIVSIASIVRHPLNQLFVLESAGIQSPKDLIGKKIGYPSIPLNQAIVNTMVSDDGGDASALNYVDIGWDLIPAMTTGKVDAIIGGYVNHEKLLLEREGVKLLAFEPADYGVPDYDELVLTASEAGIEENGDAFRKFLEAIVKGYDYTANHPDEALQLLLDKQNNNYPLEADIEKQSLAILLPLMDAAPEAFGSQSEQSWRSTIAWLAEHGQLKREIEAGEAFRNLLE
ncbi:ABC transporter substrate-binding protein [Paenibacillaceae bacterium]|nr:ABC transporter substrate-binding protein [Paenibacillaceae bacterium]